MASIIGFVIRENIFKASLLKSFMITAISGVWRDMSRLVSNIHFKKITRHTAKKTRIGTINSIA